MLGNCDKMALVVTPPKMTNNQWPHPQSTTDDDAIDDSDNNNNKVVSNSSSSMEKPGLQHQQQVALKCPRCDSANTKFCYYNNYSLSQPRHFCKACKRYWTRGGTLRNVPVGGGCRKNKHQHLKRPSTSSTSSTTIDDSATSPSSQPQPHQIDAIASTSNHHINPWFYGLADIPACDVNLPLFSSRYSSSRVSSCSGLFDLIQPQMNSLGMGLSRGVMSSDNGLIRNNEFTSNNNNNSMLFPSSYSSIFASSSSSTTPDMMPNNNSLLGSNLMMMMQQQKLMNVGVKDDGPVGRKNTTFHDQGLVVAPRIEQVQRMAVISGDNDDLHSGSGCGVGAAASKDVKVELGHNRLLELWNNNNGASGTTSTAANNCQNQIQHHVMTFSDPNSLHWNSTAEAAALGSSGANWNDDQPNNIGPSVTSDLI